MDNNKIDAKLRIIMWFVVLLFFVIYYGNIVMMVISTFSDKTGTCWMRYNKTENGLSTDTLTSSQYITLSASGNYNTISTVDPSTHKTYMIPNPATYGYWYNAGTIKSEKVTFEISGNVSLCKSYLPLYDLQNNSVRTPMHPVRQDDGSIINKRIEIPRVGESGSLALRFPSDSGYWRNVAEVMTGDNIQLLVGPSITPTNSASLNAVYMLDAFTNANTTPVDCTNTILPPSSGSNGVDVNGQYAICGRFTPYANTDYISGCYSVVTTKCGEYSCRDGVGRYHTCYGRLGSNAMDCEEDHCDRGGTDFCGLAGASRGEPNDGRIIDTKYEPDTSDAPTAFDYPSWDSNGSIIDGANNFGYSPYVTDYLKKGEYNSNQCVDSSSNDTIASRSKNYKYWLTEGRGLILQFAGNTAAPTAIGGVASTGAGVTVLPSNWPTQPPAAIPGALSKPPGNIIYSNTIPSSDVTSGSSMMLQLGYIDQGSPSAENFGGYVIYVNHTKCNRDKGNFYNDTYEVRGRIDYYFAPTDYDLNNLKKKDTKDMKHGFLDFNQGSNVTIDVPDGEHNLWLRVNNDPADYKDSQGDYMVKVGQMQKVGIFTGKVLMPIFSKVDGLIEAAGVNVFKSLTCYGKDPGKCTDFFLYIKSLLTLYVFLFGAMFLMGKIQLNQKEFLEHVIKIILIGGLINGSTFNYLNQHIFPLVIGFSDQIIANFGGYSSKDPFTFLDQAMSTLLFNKLALFQMFALISGGLTGIAMFIITAIGIVIFVMGVFQALATYIFAKLLVAFLIGLSPLFLTFALFKRTQQFFQKWLNNLIKYMMEPVIVIMGLAIFTKLFTIYLDRLLGYSVCYKCAIPFKIPSLISNFLPGFPSAFNDIVIFCFHWFAPWGVDSRSGMIALSFPDMIALGIIAFMNYTYVEFAPSIVSALTSVGSTSAASLGATAGKSVTGGFGGDSIEFGKMVINNYNKNRSGDRPKAKQARAIEKSTLKKESLEKGKTAGNFLSDSTKLDGGNKHDLGAMKTSSEMSKVNPTDSSMRAKGSGFDSEKMKPKPEDPSDGGDKK